MRIAIFTIIIILVCIFEYLVERFGYPPSWTSRRIIEGILVVYGLFACVSLMIDYHRKDK